MNEKTKIPVTKWLADRKTKVVIGVAAVSTTAAVLMRTGIRQHNDFLREKGLFDEFYTVD